MNIKFHSSVLIAKDIGKLRNFYENILKQEIESDFGNCVSYKCGLSLWELKSDYTIAKALKYKYDKSGNKNLELCFETDEFTNTVELIKQHNLKLLHDVTIESWGQMTIRFFDPENNLIELGETIPSFVQRLSMEGMTDEKIALKTSIPLKIVRGYLN